MKNLVIVESPAKAKTINKYLGSDYQVLASFGHIRDLPAKDGSVLPDDDFKMAWELSERSGKAVSAITKAARESDAIFLATDPDREGEAISWHIQEVLGEKKLLKGKTIRRVTFNAITKNAVLEAFEKARQVDSALVEAYLARRALDYLVGFTLSPVLWRKLPGAKSAGRVQSVALRLICDREAEIENFKSREYWSVEALLCNAAGDVFTAALTHLDGVKLDKFTLDSREKAEEAATKIAAAMLRVSSLEAKQVKRHPPAPFITSSLQMEASRKLGMSATQTMRTAQKLYEGVELGGETVGLITYMRTDGVSLSPEAIAAARDVIARDFGKPYLPEKPRIYKSTAKNAQEAHEAIRPTDLHRKPEQVARYLDKDALRLYELIWQRTMAAEMESAVFDQMVVDIAGTNVGLRAVGSVLKFDGFLKLYREETGDDDKDDDDASRRLPPLAKDEGLTQKSVTPEQHFTQPPPRFSEASLVKRLEELGIGRPSTYASIMQVLQDRSYVRLDKKRFYPEDRGRIVTSFLTGYFGRYVEYDFTAALETQLDQIADGATQWKAVLQAFWVDFISAIAATRDLKISDVIDALDAELGEHFFPQNPDLPDHNPRACPSCGEGRLGLKLAKTGAFIGCSRYPECRYTRPLKIEEGADGEMVTIGDGPKILGTDPDTGLQVSLRRGPYGVYVQLDLPPDADKKAKPKRASLSKEMDAASLTLEQALALLSLPRTIGIHPETGEVIQAGLGRFGPYLKLGAAFRSLPAGEDILTIGMNRAVDILAQPQQARGRTAAAPLRVLGNHPEDDKPVEAGNGRYGPFVKHGKIYANLPKGSDPDAATLEQALELLAERAGKESSGKKAPAKIAAKKAAAKKPAAKTTAEKKPAEKKPATRKAASEKTTEKPVKPKKAKTA